MRLQIFRQIFPHQIQHLVENVPMLKLWKLHPGHHHKFIIVNPSKVLMLPILPLSQLTWNRHLGRRKLMKQGQVFLFSFISWILSYKDQPIPQTFYHCVCWQKWHLWWARCTTQKSQKCCKEARLGISKYKFGYDNQMLIKRINKDIESVKSKFNMYMLWMYDVIPI